MVKSADAFRTISEVADWLDIQPHVLRFWESKFSQIKPTQRAGGRRYYRPKDMLFIGGLKKLLHEDGMTIKGAQKLIRERGLAYVCDLSQPLEDGLTDDLEVAVRDAVVTIEDTTSADINVEMVSAEMGTAPAPDRIDETPQQNDDDAPKVVHLNDVAAAPKRPRIQMVSEPRQFDLFGEPEPESDPVIENIFADIHVDATHAALMSALKNADAIKSKLKHRGDEILSAFKTVLDQRQH